MAAKPIPLKEEFALPPELMQIKPEILQLLLPDLSISAKANDCHSITYTLTVSPGRILGFGYKQVVVRVIDKVKDGEDIISEARPTLNFAGGSVTGTIEWSMPPDVEFTPDFHNEITVIVDPDHLIAERNEQNNSVTLIGTCIG